MRLLQLEELTRAEVGAWAELAERAVEPNPFFEPAFVRAVAASPNTSSPELLIAEDANGWTACVPVCVSRLLGKNVALTPWRHPYSGMGTPLVDEASVDDFATSLVDKLDGWRGSRFLILNRASDDTVLERLRDAVEHSSTVRILYKRTAERAVVARRWNPDDYLTKMKPHRRREIKRKRERLAEALETDLIATDQSGNEGAIDEFLQLEASGWKGERGTAMAVCGDADTFRTICRSFAREGRLQLLALEAQGRPIAMQCNIRGGDTLFNFKVAFDERLKRYAPGIQLELDTIRIFHEERVEQLLDPCADPGNELLNHIFPDRRRISTVIIGPRGPSGKVVSRALGAILDRRATA